LLANREITFDERHRV